MTDINISNADTLAQGFTALMKGWRDSTHGPKPTAQMLAVGALTAKRGAGKQALAVAMMLRPEGATAGQVIIACGAPQFNHMRELVTTRTLARDPAAGKNAHGHTVYRVTLTDKGAKTLDKLLTAQAAATAEGAGDKPAKPKAKRKAPAKRKPKGEPAPAPVEAQAPQAPEGAAQGEPAAPAATE